MGRETRKVLKTKERERLAQDVAAWSLAPKWKGRHLREPGISVPLRQEPFLMLQWQRKKV